MDVKMFLNKFMKIIIILLIGSLIIDNPLLLSKIH